MQKNEIVITNEYSGLRADVVVSLKLSITRSYVKGLCNQGNLYINGKQCQASKVVKEGDIITFTLPENKSLDLEPENIDIDIVYQDNDLAVINKPQGLTVHAGNGTHGKTLVNALLYHLDNLSGINGVLRPGIVHRIDKNTSGLLVVAKNDKAHLNLSKQIENKTCKRIYVALLEGVIKQDSGIIETFISRSERDRTKMSVSNAGRLAITEYRVIQRFQSYTLCEFSLKTGRTHQIRVHAKHIGHPVVGDNEYGYKNQKFKLNGQLLHAKRLEFIHPTSNKLVSFECDLPEYFKKVINCLR